MVQELDPSLKSDIRSPYAVIGFHAFGKPGEYAATIVVQVLSFGASIVFIILLAEITHSLLEKQVHLSQCEWILIFGAALTPMTFLGTPKEFWGMALFSLGSTLIADILIIVQLVMQEGEVVVVQSEFTSSGLFISFATILFAFGGATAFPNIQNDMKQREKFSLAVIIAFTLMVVMYMSISITGYMILGDKADSDILNNLNDGGLKITVQILLLVHLFFTYSVVLNPLCQQAEDIVGAPPNFSWQRVVLRTTLVIFGTFLALSLPSFGKVLGLLGGCLLPPACFIFPCVFYLRIAGKMEPPRIIPMWEKITLLTVVVICALGGVAATYTSIEDIISDPLSRPCYLQTEVWQH